jgi:signal transduction histidine kinase
MENKELTVNGIKQQSELTTELLKLFLKTYSRREFLDASLKKIVEWTGITCAGIRVLDTQGNIPYEVYRGFAPEFIRKEHWLSIGKDNCICIRIIKGQPEAPDLSNLTPSGSFCCNNLNQKIETLTEREKKYFRGTCLGQGYASLAVIPIRYGENILGALHLADPQPDKINPSAFKFLEETIASIIGEGLYRFTVESNLQQNLDTQSALISLLKYSLEDLSTESVLDLTLDIIQDAQIIQPEYKSAIYLTGEKPGWLTLKAARNFDAVDLAHCLQIALDNNCCAAAIREQKLQYAKHNPDDKEDLCCSNAASHYSVPIVFQKTVLGVIFILHAAGHRRNAEEEQFLSAVSDTLAGIIRRQRSEEMLRSLSLKMVRVQEEERRSVAMELHDQVGQMLTGLKLMIGQALRANQSEPSETLSEAQDTVTELIIKIREMSLNLRPSMLDDLGLLPTLIWHFQRVKTQSDLSIDFRHRGLERDFQKDIKIAAYRIIQEAITNILRYAGVKEALIGVWAESERLLIRVEDKGLGFKPDEVIGGSTFGLQGMRERAVLLGGSLTIDSTPGQGTVVMAELPLNEKTASA